MNATLAQRISIGAMLVVAATSLCAGCSHGKKQAATASTPSVTGSNLSSSGNGRSILSGKCAACHGSPQVSSYTLAQWTGSIIPSMAPKAGLSSADTQALIDYVNSVLKNSSP